MRRNFQPHESRGLSSVWQPTNAEPQPSSDVPTRPISSGYGLAGVRAGGYAANAQPQSSFMNIRVDELPTDSAEAMPIVPDALVPDVPKSRIPTPSLDIPDAHIASRYHMRRAHASGGALGRSPIEIALAKRLEPSNMPLTAEQLEQVKDLYFALRAASLSVPGSPYKPMLPHEIYDAVKHLFLLVSPLPTNHTSDAEGTLNLLRLLGYYDDRLEVVTFALRSSYLNASWPHIVDMLSWLVDLTGVGDSDGDSADRRSRAHLHDPESTDLLAGETDLTSEKYLEFAEISAFSLLQAQTESHAQSRDPSQGPSQNGEIPDEYLSEVRETLARYVNGMAAAVETHQSTLDELNQQINELGLELTGFTEDISACEHLRQDIVNVKAELDRATVEGHNKREEISRLRSHLGDLEKRGEVDAAETEKVHAEVISCGLSSVSEAVSLASSLHDLRSRHERLARSVNEAAERAVSEFERPARTELTSVRIALDEYNEGLGTDVTVSGSIPRDLDSIWGKSMLSLLGGDPQIDLSALKRKWEEQHASERSLLQKLEDDFDIMEAEIASLEARTASHNREVEDHNQTVARLESDRETVDEMIASLQNEQLTRKERISRHKLQLQASTKLIETLEARIVQLKEEEANHRPKIERSIKRKQVYEMKLLEYQNAYSLLEQNIREVEGATAGLSQARLDANVWIQDLKPSSTSLQEQPEADDARYSRARALELLNH